MDDNGYSVETVKYKEESEQIISSKEEKIKIILKRISGQGKDLEISLLKSFPSLFKKIQNLNVQSQYDYYISLQQSLITPSSDKIIMEAMGRLESKVDELSKKIENLSAKSGEQEKEYEDCIVYFKERGECHKAFSYLQNKEIDFQPIGSGTIMTTQKVAEILKDGSFKFGTAKNTKELYEKEPDLIKNYAEQVRKHHKLSSWTNH